MVGTEAKGSGLTREQDIEVECRKKRNGAFGEGTVTWRERERAEGQTDRGMGAWLLK